MPNMLKICLLLSVFVHKIAWWVCTRILSHVCNGILKECTCKSKYAEFNILAKSKIVQMFKMAGEYNQCHWCQE